MSRRLHRGVATQVASAADPARRDYGRIATPFTAMNGGATGAMKLDMGIDENAARTSSSRYIRK